MTEIIGGFAKILPQTLHKYGFIFSIAIRYEN
jgi:hypothetical protein